MASWLAGMAFIAPLMDNPEKHNDIDSISAVLLIIGIAVVMSYYTMKYYKRILIKDEYYGIPRKDWAIYGICSFLGGFAMTGFLMFLESS